MKELESYLNQVLQADTLIFTLAVRTFFQFDFLKRRAKGKRQLRDSDDSKNPPADSSIHTGFGDDRLAN